MSAEIDATIQSVAQRRDRRELTDLGWQCAEEIGVGNVPGEVKPGAVGKNEAGRGINNLNEHPLNLREGPKRGRERSSPGERVAEIPGDDELGNEEEKKQADSLVSSLRFPMEAGIEEGAGRDSIVLGEIRTASKK